MFTEPDHKYEHWRMTRYFYIVIIRAISVHSLNVIMSSYIDDKVSLALTLCNYLSEPDLDFMV